MRKTIEKLITEQSYLYFIENHPAIIMILDSDSGNIIQVNKAAELFYGFSKEEFAQINISDINTYTKAEIRLEMDLAKSQERNYFKFKHRIKSGKVRDVEVISFPITIETGEYLFSFINPNESFSMENERQSFNYNPLFHPEELHLSLGQLYSRFLPS